MSTPQLTPEEMLLLAMLAEGKSTKEISAKVELSVSSVKAALQRLYRKLRVKKRSAAAVWYVENGNTLAVSTNSARWYWHTYVKGTFEPAIARWLGTPERERPEEMRACVALMFLLDGREDLALAESTHLDNIAANVFRLMHAWRGGANPKAVTDYVYALPVTSRLRHVGLLALYFLGLDLGEMTIATRAIHQLYIEQVRELAFRTD